MTTDHNINDDCNIICKHPNIGGRLRGLRDKHGITRNALGKALGISTSYLSLIESGARNSMSPSMLGKLAIYFRVSPEWLETGADVDLIASLTHEYSQAIDESGLRDEAAQTAFQVGAILDGFPTLSRQTRASLSKEIGRLIDGFCQTCAERDGKIRDIGLKLARAKIDPNFQSIVENSIKSDTLHSMSSLLENLLARVKKLTCAHGEKTELARVLKVSPQAVHAYLNGASAPSAEVTLQLQKWVEMRESEQKEGPAVVRATTEPKTRIRKSNAKPNSGPPRK